MLQTKISHITTPIEHDWVPYEDISDNLKLAVIGAEDQLFPNHYGFDFKALKQAYWQNRKSGERAYGASTLTQQVAKNLFLWPGKSYIRKGLEAYLTVLIELLWSKQRILEVYLNIAQFDEFVFGAEAAAQHYLQTSASSMSTRNAARLASLLPNPKAPLFHVPGPATRNKVAHIERQMRNLGISYLARIE